MGIVLSSSICASAGIYGVYSLSGATTGPINSGILSNPYVDGIVLRYDWNAIEPQDGVFNWSTIDNQIAQVRAHGKMISLGVKAGFRSPSWIYAEGAQKFDFVWDLPSLAPLCSVQSLPVPWDPIFLSKWNLFVQALGRRYSSNAALTDVKISGINSKTEELTLPHSVNVAINGGQCTSYNDVENWQAIGYTRTKVENAWQQIADTFHSSFPLPNITAQLVPGGVPPIDANGQIIPGEAVDYELSEDLLNRGISDYRLFAGENNGLSKTWIWQSLVAVAGQITTGYQTLGIMGSNLQPALNLAIKSGAKFVEVYGQDVLDPSQQSTLANAHQILH